MMFGPTLPLLLLALPVAMAVVVFFAGLFSWLRRPPALPRAVIVERAKGAR